LNDAIPEWHSLLGIAHKDMGHSVVARGLLWPPMDAFQSAAKAWCKKYNVTLDEFVKSLE
jgi:hypothetical protein